MQRAPQVQECRGQSDRVIITARVEDGAWLMGPRVNRGVGEVLDRPLPRPWTPRGRRWGWTAVSWRADIRTEGDQRKGSGEAYLTGMKTTLSPLSAQVVDPLDCSDAGLGPRLKHVRQAQYWQGIAAAVPAHRSVGVRAPVHAARQAAGLETRLAQAAQKRAALTPARGRGKRQITDEAPRLEAIAPVLNAPRVAGGLSLAWAPPIARQTHDVGRGRGSAQRAPRVPETRRAHLTRRARREGPLADRLPRVGWKAWVTNAAPARLSWAAAVVGYRNAYRRERIFTRLTSRVSIAPLWVPREDHRQGLPSLVTWGVRV